MTKEQISSYTMRISQANTAQLALILYEIIIGSVEDALFNFEKNDMDSFEHDVVQAQNFLQELISMSRMDSKTAADTMSIYLFVDHELLMSLVKKQPANLTECLGYLKSLQKSFVTIAETDTDGPLMENTQQVYAGLTYGKGYLNESMDPMGNPNRGFQA